MGEPRLPVSPETTSIKVPDTGTRKVVLFVRSPFSPYISAVAAGVIVGISGPLLASTGSQIGHVAHVTFSSGWSWAALAFCTGMLGGSKKRSAAVGTLSLVVAVLAYYLIKAAQGDFQSADLNDPTGQTTYFAWSEYFLMVALWWFFACLLGPGLGVAGHMALRGSYRLPCRLVVPFVAIVETSMRLISEAAQQSSVVATTWSVTRIVAAATVLALGACAVVGVRRRRSAEQVPS